jgi:hypothetical protein
MTGGTGNRGKIDFWSFGERFGSLALICLVRVDSILTRTSQAVASTSFRFSTRD